MKGILTFSVILLVVSATMAQYNEDFSRELFYVSLMANCKADKILTDNCGPASKLLVETLGLEVLHAWTNDEPINNLTTVILKKEKDNMLYVGFSGTKHMAQLVQDIVAPDAVDYTIHQDIEGAKVLKYFNDKYTKNFRVNLINHIKEVQKQYPSFDVVFTGHSLGAGMATLALADYILLGLGEGKQVYGYTFGQPRLSNYKFMDAFLPKLAGFYRIVHENDVVAHVPPCIVDSNFVCKKEGKLPRFYPYHAPEEIWYNEDWTDFTTCSTDKGEDSKCSDKGRNDSLKDHVAYFGIKDIGEFIGGDYE